MTFGGKADALLWLQKDFLVPAFFVVTPEDDLGDVLEKFDTLGAEKVAVRSSGMQEDGQKTSWAGQLETYLGVGRDGVVEAVQKCRASAGSRRAQSYAKTHGSVGGVAVIVQVMLQPAESGVAFSRHPVTGTEQVVVEAVKGLGKQLVNGSVTPDTYVENGDVHLSGKTPVLTGEQQREVTTLCKKVAQFLGYDADIEWAYEEDTLYLLQARPITTV